jgi:hypothetical protein
VSAHFRDVALATPELWKRVPLELQRADPETIGKASALLHHCMALASSVNVSISGSLNGQNTRSAIEVLFASDATQKIKAFELSASSAKPLGGETPRLLLSRTRHIELTS